MVFAKKIRPEVTKYRFNKINYITAVSKFENKYFRLETFFCENHRLEYCGQCQGRGIFLKRDIQPRGIIKCKSTEFYSPSFKFKLVLRLNSVYGYCLVLSWY